MAGQNHKSELKSKRGLQGFWGNGRQEATETARQDACPAEMVANLRKR